MPIRFRQTVASVMLLSLLLLPLLPVLPRPSVNRKPHPDPVLGVHGRMTDEVERWKIEWNMEKIRGMGATWLVEYFPWAYMEPSRGRFDWEHSDMVVDAAASRGLRLIARLDMVPPWARPSGSPSQYLEEERFDDYARFVARFVDRYRGKLHDVVIWNEPNLGSEWGFRPPDPASYTRLLKAAYEAAKAADPTVSVAAAGLAPTLESSERGMSDLLFLRAMYEAGAGPYFDKLAAHSYGWRSPPDAPPGEDRINFARIELLRQVMVDHGDEQKRILLTEAGWNDHPRWTKSIRPAQRIQYSLRALEKAQTEWPWVETLCFWSFRLPRDARNYNDYFTFVTSDLRPKPIYEAFRKRAETPPGQVRPIGRIGG